MNPEFYEDEVIEGFYVPSMLKKAWGAQLDVLHETDVICRRHNIPYFADWGTLLAAIRHGGYIPWDDDMDISMRRSDYDRFVKYAEKELPPGFVVQNYKNTPGHHFFVSRIVGKPRICFEEDHLTRFRGFPYIAGIDLYILDNVCTDREKEKQKAKSAEYVLAVADELAEGRIKGAAAEELLSKCEAYSSGRIDRSLTGERLRIRMYEIIEEIFSSIPDDESDALVQMMPYGLFGRSLYIPKEYYRETVRLPYENTTIPVPICFDAVMRMKFGNYMKIVKDGNCHDYPFFYGQHRSLLETLDFEYPAYHARRADIMGERIRKSGLSQIAIEYAERFSTYAERLGNNDKEAAVMLQDEAIQLGTAIESVYGEGYGPVSFLEELCELVYRAYEGEDVPEIERCISYLRQSIEENLSGHDAVLMPFAAKYWKYMEKAFCYYRDNGYRVHVIPIPYFYKAYDGAFTDEVSGGSYPDDIPIEDIGSVDLGLLHPEKIVIQNPFDEWNTVMSVPPELFSSKIRQFTDELIYVPFFVTDDFSREAKREYINMDAYVCVPGVINSDAVILPSQMLKNTYIEKIMEFTGTKGDDEVRNVLNDRIQVRPELVYDGKDDAPEDSRGKKTVMFYTSISSLAENGENAVRKIRNAIKILSEDPEKIHIIWVSSLLGGSEYLISSVTDLYRKTVGEFLDEEKGEYIEDADKQKLLEYAGRCSAYYGEPSALALKFFYNKKPVMIRYDI